MCCRVQTNINQIYIFSVLLKIKICQNEICPGLQLVKLAVKLVAVITTLCCSPAELVSDQGLAAVWL